MEIPKDQYWEDFDIGEMHIRDRWQFELKSEFFPNVQTSANEYVQEFYLFIPNALQINSGTYFKQQFYLDQTNLFRYKTPIFTFSQLFDSQNTDSPLSRLMNPNEKIEQCTDELKLLANIVRSTLRNEVKELIGKLAISKTQTVSSYSDFISQTHDLCLDIEHLQKSYRIIKKNLVKCILNPIISHQLSYVEEFIEETILHYISRLLENIQLNDDVQLQTIKNLLTEILLKEKKVEKLDISFQQQDTDAYDPIDHENFVYRTSMLNKFIIDALQLTTNRFSMDQRYQHLISGMSAGIAMLVYFSLYVWLGNVFVMNSEPFILLTVVIYILKDRIKDWLRTFSYFYLHSSQWFPDYTTIIQPINQKAALGVIKESFSFIQPEQLPQSIKDVRNAEFHTVLETYQRPESVIFYKRIVKINNLPKKLDSRRCGLNFIFRFNIHQFLYKASDPKEAHLTIDPKTKKLLTIRLPKVYHLNIIIRTISKINEHSHIEIKKIRLVIDKNGIKRIEQLGNILKT